jgi:hypothetical protein
MENISSKILRDASNPAVHAAYREEVRRLIEEFKSDNDLEIVGNPKAELLWSKAWELGHSSDVYSYASDLVDLK